jgi:S1-C subfamily serine protease
MSRSGRTRFRPLLWTALALSICSPAVAQAADPASEDAARSATIERVKRSIVHIKSVLPPVDPLGIAAPRRGRGDRKTAEALQRFHDKFAPGVRRQEGNGFVIDAARGLILTAAQVVSEVGELTLVLPDGSERPARRVAVDQDRGIALLRSEGLALPELRLATRPARTGETTLVVGWMIPLRTILATEGMVTGLAPAGTFKSDQAPKLADYVVIDNSLPNGGFGGSPVVDRSGEVLGLVSAIYGRGYGHDALTMIIPAAALQGRLQEMIDAATVTPEP